MFLPWFFLCIVVSLTVGYGYSNQDYGNKKGCRKLKHFDIADSGRLNRRAKFSHLKRHGKHYTMITCPNDSFMYSLVAEHEGSVFNIFGSEYQDTIVLAAGYNVGVVAKCDGKRTTVETTDGNKIKIKRVACIQNNEGVIKTSTASTTTPMPCTTCDTGSIAPGIIYRANLTYDDITTPGECKKAKLTCSAEGVPCGRVGITVYGSGESKNYDTPPPVVVISTDITCQADGSWNMGEDVRNQQDRLLFIQLLGLK
ncbi:unnamed protein product [Caenorhabditis brenneri]